MGGSSTGDLVDGRCGQHATARHPIGGAGPVSVSVKVMGGLGNQMFQAAAGLALAERLGADLVIDMSYYAKDRRERGFALDVFPLVGDGMAAVTMPNRVWSKLRTLAHLPGASRVYREPDFGYDPAFETLTAPVSLDGYFQSERYFADAADTIRAAFAPPEPADTASLDIAAAGPFGVLHVRRGDYLTAANQALFTSLDAGYYGRALNELPDDLPVVVLSDDVRWAHDNIEARQALIFPGLERPRPPLADLWLMSRASHHIIANSSFSWWGAWLSEPKSGVTVAPRQWFRDNAKSSDDLLPPRWARL